MEIRKVYDDWSHLNQKSTAGIYTMVGFSETKGKDMTDGHERRKNQSPRKKQDYFNILVKTADASNNVLEIKNLPYRFSVYMKSNSIFIDFITYDLKKKPKNVQTIEVTPMNFNKWVKNISNIAGFYIDKSG
jgi:hypothetical protein